MEKELKTIQSQHSYSTSHLTTCTPKEKKRQEEEEEEEEEIMSEVDLGDNNNSTTVHVIHLDNDNNDDKKKKKKEKRKSTFGTTSTALIQGEEYQKGGGGVSGVYEIEKLSRQLVEVQSQYDLSREARDMLTQELKVKSEGLTRLKSESIAYREENHRLKTDNEQLRGEISKLYSTQRVLNGQVQQLERKLSVARRDIGTLHEKYVARARQSEASSGEKRARVEEKARLVGELETCRERVREMGRERDAKEDEREALRVELAEVMRRLREMEMMKGRWEKERKRIKGKEEEDDCELLEQPGKEEEAEGKEEDKESGDTQKQQKQAAVREVSLSSSTSSSSSAALFSSRYHASSCTQCVERENEVCLVRASLGEKARELELIKQAYVKQSHLMRKMVDELEEDLVNKSAPSSSSSSTIHQKTRRSTSPQQSDTALGQAGTLTTVGNVHYSSGSGLKENQRLRRAGDEALDVLGEEVEEEDEEEEDISVITFTDEQLSRMKDYKPSSSNSQERSDNVSKVLKNQQQKYQQQPLFGSNPGDGRGACRGRKRGERGSSRRTSQVVEQLQRVANELSERVQEKDEALDHQRVANRQLGRLLQEKDSVVKQMQRELSVLKKKMQKMEHNHKKQKRASSVDNRPREQNAQVNETANNSNETSSKPGKEFEERQQDAEYDTVAEGDVGVSYGDLSSANEDLDGGSVSYCENENNTSTLATTTKPATSPLRLIGANVSPVHTKSSPVVARPRASRPMPTCTTGDSEVDGFLKEIETASTMLKYQPNRPTKKSLQRNGDPNDGDDAGCVVDSNDCHSDSDYSGL
eukprot:Nk52_evm8s348 gene=Nk52_evmTU8s348